MKTRKLFVFDDNQLLYKPVSMTRCTFFGIVILVIGLIAGVCSVQPNNIRSEGSIFAFKTTSKPFSEKNFKEYMSEIGIRFPEVVFAQAIQESGLKSPRFKNTHSLFSLRKANNRPSTAIDYDEEGYCIYENWQQSVLDYALYQTTYTRSIKTQEQYLEYLKSSYAEDTSYVSRLIQLIPKYYGRD